MHRRRLATTEELIAIESPDSEEAHDQLAAVANDQGLDFETVEVGESIADIYREERATIGVTLGGDGTFLEGIRTFAPRGVPLLGLNTGTLAFLARVAIADLEDAIAEILRGRAHVDDRQQLRISTEGLDTTGINDVMIRHIQPDNPVNRKITRLHVFADDEYVGMYEGTGLAIATPTGSTGVSLSANGPVHYPKNNHTLQLIPLHTHRMGVRPLIVGADTELEIITEGPANLLLDGGRSYMTLGADDTVTVTGADQPAHIVRTSYDDHFFTAISEKLGWGLREADATGPRQPLESAVSHTSEKSVPERALEVAMEAARGAGEPLRDLHGQVESIEFKSDKADIVTEADYQAERIIATVIENEFPEHAIRSEESVHRDGPDDNPYLWLLDPLDGTGNFAHGNPNYAISIALLRDGAPVMGVVYAPETDELFHAIAGDDAYEGGNRLVTTDRDQLDESMLLSGYDPDGSFLSHFYQATRGVRRVGAAALNLCYLASGTADAVWEYDTYPWDVAAGLVIARAAGATVTTATGEPYALHLDGTEHRTELLGSNGPLHQSLLDHLRTDDGELEEFIGATDGG